MSLRLLSSSCARAGSLATLVLSNCSALAALPSFKVLGYTLEWLDVFDCPALTSLPPTLGCLAHIYELDLSGCTALAELPDSLTDMHQLIRCALLLGHVPGQHTARFSAGEPSGPAITQRSWSACVV